MLEFFITLSLFNVTCLLIPLLMFNYGFLKITHFLWIYGLSFLNPDLDFLKYSTIRTLLDTHRNQGIISVLLTVRGPAQLESVRRHLQEVVRRKDKTGKLTFPRLQQCLVTKCGVYAWRRNSFDLDQNLLLAPFTYKGRAVTEYNIQEYVSDIVSKYLPTTVPPWQIVIIPSSEDNHYILLKIHHVLLTEGVNIGDLLPLIPPTRQSIGAAVTKSPLVEVFKKPENIPLFKEKLSEELCNRWNEFVSNSDPLERPKLLKDNPTLRQFLAISMVTFVSIVKECKKGFRVIKHDYSSKIKYITLTISRECNKRQVSIHVFLLSLLKTLNPKNVFINIFKSLFYLLLVLPVQVPTIIYAEIWALYSCITLKYCPHPHTFVGIVYTYTPLIYNSLKEVFYILSILFHAPKNIIQDILLQEESLETITLCGRKAVAWSDAVKTEEVKAMARKSGVSQTEVMLSAICLGISKYFSQTNHNMPEQLPVTIRNINSLYLFATGPNVRIENAVSGILFLNLPVVDPERSVSQMDNLEEIKTRFQEAIEKQGLSHLLTMLQTKFGILTNFLPETVVSVYLKYLSRKYAVTITEVTNRYPYVRQRTLWGQEVMNVIYWRPPQANTCISLCINEYADHIKLGVMCDAQLVPHHSILVRGFPEFLKDFSKNA